MCGIAALSFVNPSERGLEIMSGMLSSQEHRGPDATLHYRDDTGRTWLGHNRLSIIDLSPRGNQPMSNEDGTLWLVANGEIYNFQVLRAELEAGGHRFRSDSDCEVILHLYEEEGPKLLDRLHGMFAFVLFDARTGELFCARDRVGKKPLVYGCTPLGVVIASEIPAALQMPGVNRTPDPVAVALYFLRNLRHIPDPFTLFRGLRRLNPGHAMIVARGKVQRVWRYWRPSFDKRNVMASEVRRLLDGAVALRLIADTEVAAMLSGGVDSTAIVKTMVEQGAQNVRTYALGLNAEDEELVRARQAAAVLGTNHREFYFDPDRQHALMLDLLKIYGEPVALLPLVHSYELCRHIRDDGIKVVLSGHGADELFYGYTGFVQLALLSRIIDACPRGLARLAGNAAACFRPGSAAREGLLVASHDPGRRKAALYLDEADRLWPELLIPGPDVEAWRAALQDLLDTWISDTPPSDYIDEAAILGLMHENAHSLTIAADLSGMAASIEMRCPFLDQDLVQLAWNIPYAAKVGSLTDATQLKLILKQAVADRVPHALLYAPKRGFGYNISEAKVLAGPWKAQVDSALMDLGNTGLLNREGLRRLKTDFDRNPNSHNAMLVSKCYALALTTQANAA